MQVPRLQQTTTFQFCRRQSGKTHKQEGLINVRYLRKCQFQGCNKRPCFNFNGENQGILCATNKQEGIINVHDKIFQFDGFNKIPVFN